MRNCREAFSCLVVLAGLVALSSLALADEGRRATRTTLSVSPGQSAEGQAVTLTATVAPAGGDKRPQGTVEFSVGPRQLGVANLAAEGDVTATLQTSALPAGMHQLTARYLGHPDFLPSVAPPVPHAVNRQQ